MLTVQITPEQAKRACAFGETHFLDRKSRRIAPAKLTRTISAFANSDGGEIYVGIEDDGTWDGLYPFDEHRRTDTFTTRLGRDQRPDPGSN